MHHRTTRARNALHNGGHVVVLGAGMAGLAAAAAATAEVEQVTIVERDDLSDATGPRRGVPQGQHIHALLAGGRVALEQLLPGLDDELARHGAPLANHGDGFGFRTAHGWVLPVPEVRIRCASRPQIETTARRLVDRLDGVRVLDGWHASGFIQRDDGGVGGVVGDQRGQTVRLHADLVVDATGRGSSTPSWLAALGCDAPVEQTVDPGLWYATTSGHGEPDLPGSMQGLVIAPTPDMPAGGGVIPTGGQGHVISLTGVEGSPPRSIAEMRDHARQRLPSPAIARAMASLELEETVVRSRSTANRVRRYDRAKVPDGLVVLGDSVCALDPVYGQGMTVAALQAQLLRRLLAEAGPRRLGITEEFQKRAWAVAKLAWDQAVGADRKLPTVDMAIPKAAQALAGYADRLTKLSTTDPAVARRVARVMHMLEPPTQLFHPALVTRVAADVLRPSAGRAPWRGSWHAIGGR